MASAVIAARIDGVELVLDGVGNSTGQNGAIQVLPVLFPFQDDARPDGDILSVEGHGHVSPDKDRFGAIQRAASISVACY